MTLLYTHTFPSSRTGRYSRPLLSAIEQQRITVTVTIAANILKLRLMILHYLVELSIVTSAPFFISVPDSSIVLPALIFVTEPFQRLRDPSHFIQFISIEVSDGSTDYITSLIHLNCRLRTNSTPYKMSLNYTFPTTAFGNHQPSILIFPSLLSIMSRHINQAQMRA